MQIKFGFPLLVSTLLLLQVDTYAQTISSYLRSLGKRADAVSGSATVRFGVKALDAMACAPGAGICEAEPGNHIIRGEEAAVFTNSYGMLILQLNLEYVRQQKETALLSLINSNLDNHYVFFGGAFQYGENLITNKTPVGISLDPNYPGDSNQVMLAFMGTVPGYSANVSFDTCTAVCDCSMSFSAFTAKGKNPAYSTYLPITDNGGNLYLLMNVNNIRQQQAQYKPNFPMKNGRLDATSFVVPEDIVFDSTTAAYFSVPEGYKILAGSYQIAALNDGWISILFTVSPG